MAFITNSMLGFDGLLEYMLEDLGVAKAGESHAQRLFALQNFLIERHRAGQDTVLILDEAQDLDVRTLEQIRLLSNFETPTEKIMQILLVGQPELRAKLDLPELRQLKQRIGLRCSIPPLALDEVGHYIRTRLRVAGSPDLRLFTEQAIARIARYSGGIPRVINTVCDHCLLFGYADKARHIDRGIVDQVIQYLEDGEPRRRRTVRTQLGRWRMTPASLGLAGGHGRGRRPGRAAPCIRPAPARDDSRSRSPISRAPRARCSAYEQVLQGARGGRAGSGAPERDPPGKARPPQPCPRAGPGCRGPRAGGPAPAHGGVCGASAAVADTYLTASTTIS